ncbi:MAG: serine/threonine protein kinase [Planctomycetes bacterium]|nr:serine/threonine protein kinase [Planctomycetota bacterium]
MAQRYGDRWEVVSHLVPGGQAETFRVRDLKEGLQVAPKYVLKRLRNPERHARFRQEIEILLSLQLPGVVQIVDHQLEKDPFYLVTKYHERGSLEGHAERWKGDPTRALEFVVRLCDTLRQVHGAGVIHRDIKPANILLSDDSDSPVIADFGIAFVAGGQRMTLTDEAVGAKSFIAPELEGGRTDQVGPGADIYSIGKLYYWLVAGGSVYPREHHRGERHDLTRQYAADDRFEHVNMLLDRLVTEDPNQRPPDLANAISIMRGTLDDMNRNSRVLKSAIPQRCAFCRAGSYQSIRTSRSGDIHNFGFARVGDAKWNLLVCNRCGNVQLFRMDFVEAGTWWGPDGVVPPVKGT